MDFFCSGFAQHCYALEGYSIGRTTWDQIDDIQAAGDWKTSIDELEPGDLVFPNDGHVGIYIGDNKFVHAQNSATGVVVSALAGYYASRGFEARRIIT